MMEERCFIHFGFTTRKKFANVRLSSEKNIQCECDGIAFNVLNFNYELLNIDDVFLSWNYNLYLHDGKISYCGYQGNTSVHNISDVFSLPINEKVLKVSCGWKQALVITEEKKCYSLEIDTLNMTSIGAGDFKISNASVGDMHSVVLTDGGEVHTICFTDSSPFLSPIKLSCSISAVVCGHEHVLLLSHAGQVLSFGSASRGQLGHGDLVSRETPTILEALDGIKIKSIAVGGWHSAAVSDIGDIYMWGWNESGQIGVPCTSAHNENRKDCVAIQSIPLLISFGGEVFVSSVSCGSRHTAIITDEGTLWTWGWNEYLQLGTDHANFSDTPTAVSLPPEFVAFKVTCAYWSTLIFGTIRKQRF